MTAEYEARLADIRSGPWREQSVLARTRMPQLSPQQVYRSLRSHYEDPNGIGDPEEIAFRESFDDLLEELQLFELAVESSYLPLEVVRPAALEAFERFLLPHVAARAYLQTYDFILVRFLAERLKLDLQLGSVATPPINHNAAVRYAAFLAANAEFTASPEVTHFTMVMDDYRFKGGVDGSVLKQCLAGEAQPSDSQRERVSELSRGLAMFVQILGDFFIQVDPVQQSLFGCAFAYWLGHFFGVRRVSRGFQQLGLRFDDVAPQNAFFGAGVGDEAIEVERTRFRERIAVLATTWAKTRALLEGIGSISEG